MASLKTKFSVGLFLIIGIAVIIIAIIWLGMSNYLEKGRLVVAYFDESVQGLEKDSPVKYRGVSIGRVQKISVAPDENLIEVLLKIESKIQPHKKTSNIVAQLKSVGITGLMFVELERLPEGQPNITPRLSFTPPYPVIPTIVSDKSKIFKGIDELINAFKQMEPKTISDKLVSTLTFMEKTIRNSDFDLLLKETRSLIQNANNALADLQTAKLSAQLQKTAGVFAATAANINAAVNQLRLSLGRIDGLIAGNTERINAMMQRLDQASRHLDGSLKSLQILVNEARGTTEVAGNRLVSTLERIDTAARNLNLLIEQLTDQPSLLIFSKPPAGR